MKNSSGRNGFTIVELLIVIVVIAILAAISIVSYNGIQSRAENTKSVSAINSYIKALAIYKGNNGNYPIHVGYPCLGAVGVTCGITPASTCWSTGTASATSAFVTDMTSVIAPMPEMSKQQMSCSATGKASGGFYHSDATGSTALIYYFLNGDVSCGVTADVAVTKIPPTSGTTLCSLSFN